MKKTKKYVVTILIILAVSLLFAESITGLHIATVGVLTPIWKSFAILLLIATFIIFAAYVRSIFLKKIGVPQDSELEGRIKKSYRAMAFIGLLKSLKKKGK